MPLVVSKYMCLVVDKIARNMFCIIKSKYVVTVLGFIIKRENSVTILNGKTIYQLVIDIYKQWSYTHSKSKYG